MRTIQTGALARICALVLASVSVPRSAPASINIDVNLVQRAVVFLFAATAERWTWHIP
jgi:hypothetical protein